MGRVRVLFVCLGNICRSPTAQGIFQSMIEEKGLEDRIEIDSAGTGDWHIGRAPDPRAQKHGLEAGYDITSLRARQVQIADFDSFDYLIAMDRQNYADLEHMKPDGFTGHLKLLMDFTNQSEQQDVPDPYSFGAEAFRYAIELIEEGCAGLLNVIQKDQSARPIER